MIQNVIFDVDGVLRTLNIVPVNDLLPTHILEKYPGRYDGVSLREYFTKFLHNSIFEQFDYGNISREEMAHMICDAFNEPYEVLDYLLERRLSREQSIIFNQTIDYIKILRSKNIKTFILSNMGIDMAQQLRIFIGEENFDDIIFSSEVHMIKPNMDIYQYAIQRFGINPKESVFVDDREINLEPFAKLGGHTFLFDKNDIAGSIKKLDELIDQSGMQKSY